MRTQVGIIGAGPAGLMLSHLLHLHGISSTVVEARSREYAERRVRAGVLEHGTVELLHAAGLADRLDAEGLRHDGIELSFGGVRHRVDFAALTGRSITVYGQQEIVTDLIARRLADDGDLRFEVSGVRVGGLTSATPSITFRHDGRDHVLECDVVAGCDGFHGVTRASLPPSALRVYEQEYDFAWLGILAEAPPAVDELVYSLHDRGFALYSMRPPSISRLYLQVPAGTDLADWPDERVWDELSVRLATDGDHSLPRRGPVLDKGLTPMRGFVAEPMRHHRLFLAGDAAHIVPPTGAKGLNLALHDVRLLARALDHWYTAGDPSLLDSYSADALRRVWRAQHFSRWMTTMLHRTDRDPYSYQVQLAQLRNVVDSPAYATTLAENYAG